MTRLGSIPLLFISSLAIAALSSSSTVAQAPAGAQLLVASYGTNSVLRYGLAAAAKDGKGAQVEFMGAFIAERSGGLDGPVSIEPGPDGNLYVTSIQGGTILRYDGSSGKFMDVFVPFGTGGMSGPSVAIFGPDGNLYVTGNHLSVLRFDGRSGEFMDVFVEPGSGGLKEPTGLRFGPDGNLYVGSGINDVNERDSVLRYDGKSGKFIDAFVAPGSGGLDDPIELRFGPDGNFYVGSQASGEVLRYDGKTGEFIDAFIPKGRGNLTLPGGLAFGPDGNFYVVSGASEVAGELLRFDGKTGAFIDVVVRSGTDGLVTPTLINFLPPKG